MQKIADMRARIITGALFGILFFGSFFISSLLFSTLLLGILLTILITEWPRFFSCKKLPFWVITPLYPVLPFCLLIVLNSNPMYHYLAGLLFLAVFTFDIASYFCGKAFGKHKLAPAISPGKTWEGFIGGTFLTLAIVLILLWTQNKPLAPLWTILLVLCICTIALVGDLFESWLKRRVGLKDSGNLLPGHGGFLDRFDGVLFVTYFFYFARHFLITLM